MDMAKRIAKMRKAQDLTIEQLARLTSLPADYLKAVEGGEITPSIGAVISISRALGTKMGQILHEGGRTQGIFSILQADKVKETERETDDDQRRGRGQGYSYSSLLIPEVRGQAMEPFLISFDPSAADTVEETAHEGEEFIYVLSGVLEVIYEGKSSTLKKGDSLYIDSSRPHALRAVGNKPPQVLAVVYARS